MCTTFFFFFFFQAEDGIRDKLVTGVQTCALPISDQSALWRRQAGGLISFWPASVPQGDLKCQPDYFKVGGSGAAPPDAPHRSPVAVKDPSIDCGAKPALELPKPHGASPTLVSFDALLVDTGDGQHAAHPIGSEVGVSQESRRVHQDELLGEVDDRARALHPAHHLEA